jgi:hypothetical protein
VLPGHRGIFKDHRQRIRQLIHHHGERLNEVRKVLENGSATAFEIASQMTWDIKVASWDDFPTIQQWFATGEIISHLRYLEEEILVQRIVEGETVRFSLLKST